jgi:hypothetical protein
MLYRLQKSRINTEMSAFISEEFKIVNIKVANFNEEVLEEKMIT